MPDKGNSSGTKALTSKRKFSDSYFGGVCKQFWRNKMAVVGLFVIAALVLMAILAPLIAPYDPYQIDPINANQGPTAAHWFGTDTQGRDILSRIFYGAQYSLSLGFCACLLGTLIGMVLGAVAGFFGGVAETLILRACDVIQSIPNTLLCIVVSVTLGSGFLPTIVALSLYSIPETARMLRASLLSLREQEFVEACKATNCSSGRILLVHLIPNALSPIIVSFSLGIGMKIMSSAGLSFLGLGIQEPIAEWGAMIAAGRSVLRYAPHILIFPGIFVALVVMAFNIVGDGLRDAMDPKLRR